MKIFPSKPGTVSCLNTNRIGPNKGYGCRQVTDNSLADVLSKTRQDSHSSVAKIRFRQSESNPLKDKWKEETDQLKQYYSNVEEDSREE